MESWQRIDVYILRLVMLGVFQPAMFSCRRVNLCRDISRVQKWIFTRHKTCDLLVCSIYGSLCAIAIAKDGVCFDFHMDWNQQLFGTEVIADSVGCQFLKVSKLKRRYRKNMGSMGSPQFCVVLENRIHYKYVCFTLICARFPIWQLSCHNLGGSITRGWISFNCRDRRAWKRVGNHREGKRWFFNLGSLDQLIPMDRFDHLSRKTSTLGTFRFHFFPPNKIAKSLEDGRN